MATDAEAPSSIADPVGTDRSFRTVLDFLPAAVYVTDAGGLLTYYNAAAAALWGHSPSLGAARWCGSRRLSWPDGRPMPHDQCPMAIALREGRAIRGMEAVAERPDGSRVPFLTYPVPFLNAAGAVTGGINLLVDLTDRKSMERYVERLSSIVESSHDAIASKDLDGIITSWNRGAERLFGYTAAEAIGRPVTMLIPPDRHDEEPEILSRIRRGDAVEPYETIRRRKDGSEVHISLSVSPIRDATGRIVGASKIAHDISERIQAREQQQLLVREINHRIKNLVATVQAIARRTLSFSSDSERETFFARLSALAGAHQLLTDRSWSEVPAELVVRRAIEPFQDVGNTRLSLDGDGPARLDAETSSHLTMILHELATNAVKYGALSNDSGEVLITWRVEPHAAGDHLVLVWREEGGPPVEPPAREGFGTQLIRRVVPGDQGNVNLEYLRSGVRCTVSLLTTGAST